MVTATGRVWVREILLRGMWQACANAAIVLLGLTIFCGRYPGEALDASRTTLAIPALFALVAAAALWACSRSTQSVGPPQDDGDITHEQDAGRTSMNEQAPRPIELKQLGKIDTPEEAAEAISLLSARFGFATCTFMPGDLADAVSDHDLLLSAVNEAFGPQFTPSVRALQGTSEWYKYMVEAMTETGCQKITDILSDAAFGAAALDDGLGNLVVDDMSGNEDSRTQFTDPGEASAHALRLHQQGYRPVVEFRDGGGNLVGGAEVRDEAERPDLTE